jgi:hypothetical protein
MEGREIATRKPGEEHWGRGNSKYKGPEVDRNYLELGSVCHLLEADLILIGSVI